MLSNNFRWNSFRHNEKLHSAKLTKVLDWIFDAFWFVVSVFLLYVAIVNDDIIERISLITMFVLAVVMLVGDIVMRWVREDILEGEHDIQSQLWQLAYKDNKILFMMNPYTNRTKQEMEEEWSRINTIKSDDPITNIARKRKDLNR